MKYVLFVFGKSDKQDEFVKMVSSDVSLVSDFGDVRYYYGDDSIILTFNSLEPIESIDSFFKFIYEKLELIYMLFPFERDKMSVKMDDEIVKHLFDVETQNKPENLSEFDLKVLNLLNEKSKEFLSEEDECDELFSKNKLKKQIKEPTLDEILDKINDKGILSLTEKEVNLLNKYSNK
jgi:hypothetical protein